MSFTKSEINVGGAARCAPTDNRKFGGMPPGSLPVIVRSFKSAVTKRFHAFAPDIRVWQRNYWERILRDEGELWWYRNYIRDNPRNRKG
jgi:putative transposase